MNQFFWDRMVDFPFVFEFRAELESARTGNVSWNTGVDYRVQLANSIDRDEVVALYRKPVSVWMPTSETLQNAVRVVPTGGRSLSREKYHFNGEIHIPVLDSAYQGRRLVVVQDESAYKQVVDEAGNEEFLRRAFVSRAGHCAFTPAKPLLPC